jgi:putative Mg2+ transporter-C (MgtC) family protein
MIAVPPGLGELTGKIALSALLGGAVGAEREWTGKWAGLRTHMLIAVGSTLLAHISTRPVAGGGTWDSGRIAAQIVTGVGFIGAGTILQSRGTIHGLTTAAGLWVAAAVGIAVGAGDYAAGVVTTLALLVILAALRPLEHRLLRGHLRTIVLQLERGQKLAQIMDVIEECAVETEAIEVGRTGAPTTVTVKLRGGADAADHLIQMASLHGIHAVDETTPQRRPFP